MRVSSCLVLHGSFGSPYENWFPWIRNELVEQGVSALVPPLPTPDRQTFDNWAGILDGYRKAGLLRTDSAIIAHSSSCAFAVRYIAERELSIDMLATVAGFDHFLSGDNAFDSVNSELFTMDESNFELVKKLTRRRIAFFSQDDPYLPIEKLREFAAGLEAEVHEVPNGGHLNSESGFKSFPALLATFDIESS